MPTDAPVVDCRNVCVRYASRTVLSGFDLQVAPGEVFGLVGANGGSKTTVLRVMVGLLAPAAGDCRVFGQASQAGRGRIGYMAQGLSLYQDLTVAENIAARAGLFRVADARRAVDDTIERFGLRPYARVRVGSLSGGWARRAQFAATLIHRPALLLLDEPTVGLDAVARQDVWRHVLSLAAAGTTVVVSTHDLAEAERFSRLAFLVGGAVRATGTVADIVAGSGACSFMLDGPGAGGAAPAVLAAAGVVAAYPSAGALRVVTRLGDACRMDALAARHGLHARPVPPGLDDAAQALLHRIAA